MYFFSRKLFFLTIMPFRGKIPKLAKGLVSFFSFLHDISPNSIPIFTPSGEGVCLNVLGCYRVPQATSALAETPFPSLRLSDLVLAVRSDGHYYYFVISIPPPKKKNRDVCHRVAQSIIFFIYIFLFTPPRFPRLSSGGLALFFFSLPLPLPVCFFFFFVTHKSYCSGIRISFPPLFPFFSILLG